MFFRFANCYWQFNKGFGQIVTLFTSILKTSKNEFLENDLILASKGIIINEISRSSKFNAVKCSKSKLKYFNKKNKKTVKLKILT